MNVLSHIGLNNINNVNILLYGDTEYDYAFNCDLFKAVHRYISETDRFTLDF